MNVYEKYKNDYAINNVEYLIKKKSDGKIKLARTGIVFLCIVLSFALIYLCLGQIKFPAIAPVGIILIIYVAKMLWGLTSIEYEYSIVQGEFTMDAIYGARKRRTVAEFVIREAEKIAPFKNDIPSDVNIINACISPSHPNSWYALYKDANGDKTALLFTAHNKALELMSYYNRIATDKERIKEDFDA